MEESGRYIYIYIYIDIYICCDSSVGNRRRRTRNTTSLSVVDKPLLANSVRGMPTIYMLTHGPARHFSQTSCRHDSEPPIGVGLNLHLLWVGGGHHADVADCLCSDVISIWRNSKILSLVCITLLLISLDTAYVCSISYGVQQSTPVPA